MNKRIPPLNALHAFVVTARHLNLTRAAEELFVTQGAVSRQIATLEDYFGFALFHRHARGLRLTQQGLNLLPELKGAFEQLFKATDKACRENSVIRLKAPTCALRWLLPCLVKLEQENPEMHVSLTTTTDHGIDFKTENYDVAIIFSEDTTPFRHSYKLFDEVISPVMAPHLCDNVANNFSIENLARMTFLHPTHDQRDWKLWLQSQSVDEQIMRRNQQFDTMDLAISAAIQGFGIAMADISLVAEDIKMHRLVMPFPDTVKTGAAYYLVHRPKADTALLSEFTDWFKPKPEMPID